MGQALYRKYRSKKLSEIVGQSSVTTALSNAIKSKQISHAYLFTGPRGVGKTSVARILAYEINNVKYENDTLPIDIIEIDAASNRRIDEIRDLREKVRIAPVSAKYKIYIIDEVHMLTREAFNALLKTLEEPPAHVIFILATTEAHKLPETIVSRTQCYNFRLASIDEVIDLLRDISAKEKINIDNTALSLLAEHSGGSLRDALSLLDQVRHSSGKINEKTVRQNLGLPSKDIVEKIIENISNANSKKLMSTLRESYDDGANAGLLANQLLKYLQNQLTAGKSALPIGLQISLMQELLKVDASTKPEIQLEIALLKTQLSISPDISINQNQERVIKPLHTSPNAIKRTDNNNLPKTDPKLVSNNQLKVDDKDKSTETPVPSIATSGILKPNNDTWTNILVSLRSTHNTLYSVLRMAQPAFNNDADKPSLVLEFKFPFHQKRINDSKNKQIICNVMETQGLQGYEIICRVMEKNVKNDSSAKIIDNNILPDSPDPELDNIRNVFGGAEVLE